MKEVTVSAKTLDDAITEALIQLEITSDLLDYDVIEKGSAGFLGIGSKQAVIRARRKAEVKKVKESPRKSKKSTKDTKKSVEQKVKKTVEEDKVDSSKVDKTKVDKGKIDKNRGNRRQREDLPEIKAETPEACKKFLKDIFEIMDMEVELISKVDEDGMLNIEMKGDNMGIIIGKRGQTLDSLQYLTNRVASKVQDCYIPVKLDTENYRKKRKNTLENLAKNVAYKVKRTRRSVSLEPMNPYERRIIHSALQGERNIATYSEGEEPYRCVVVAYRR